MGKERVPPPFYRAENGKSSKYSWREKKKKEKRKSLHKSSNI
jgi:hypothetical protein